VDDSLEVAFEDGIRRCISLSRLAAKGPGLARFSEPIYARGLKLIAHGFILEAPDGTTLSASGLRRAGKRIDKPAAKLELVSPKRPRSKRLAG